MKDFSSFGLLLQGMRIDDRVLSASTVAGSRNVERSFSAKDATDVFDMLWVPRPGNIHEHLKRLEKLHLVRRALKKQHWAVTPKGNEKVRELLMGFDMATIEAQMKSLTGSNFGHVKHTLVTPAFAPIKWLEAINRLLFEYPFEQNVFLMTRFPEDKSDAHYLDPLRQVIPLLRDALSEHGLNLHLASDRQLDDDLLGNVAAHMWACNYGIGILEDRIKRGLNYNVMTELGAMLITGRRCALMKDITVPKLPTDLSGQLYKPVDIENPSGLINDIHNWAANDLSLGRCGASI